jgi:ABC-type multidrug transport system fused ATPase/permease subunit
MKIVNETLKLAHIYIKIIFISEIIALIFFELPVFVQHLMTFDEEILQEVETVDGFTKYFIFVMWLPPVVKQKFIIRVIYGLQFIYSWEISLFTASITPFYTVLYLYIGTQFKLISSIIREMDEVLYRVENPGNVLHEVTEQMFTTGTKLLSDLFKSNLDIKDPTALSTERILNEKMQQNVLQEVDINGQYEIVHDLSSPEIKPTTKNDPESFYLVECIKLHQASIE